MQTNLARLAEESLQRLGNHPTLLFEGTWYTSAELHDRSCRVARGLRDLGVGAGDRVLVIMANCPEVGIVYSAIWRAGAVATPVIFLVSTPELSHILVDSGAAAVITSPELLPNVNEAIEGRQLPVIVVGQNFADLEANDPLPIVARDPNDLAALLYTGGTTGRRKGVQLTQANLSSAGANARAARHVPGINRSITALPLSHSFGLLLTIGAYHAQEPASSVLQRGFDAPSFLHLAAEHHCQTTAVVPSMLAMLLALPLEEYNLSELQYVFSGAASLPRAVADEFERRVPSAIVIEGYGCTETAGIITTTPPLAPKRGTVGKAVPQVEIRIVGQDGADQPFGSDGEIVVRGPNVMTSYWGGEPSPDGWFHTGDVGHVDEDGYLTIVDRIKDLIIRGGYNVYPRDVEDVLTQHPAVAMAAVVGRPDERLGEEVVGFVCLTEGASVTAEELIAFAKERMAANKYPREIHIVPAIPLTSVGKLDRKLLRATLSTVDTPAPSASA